MRIGTISAGMLAGVALLVAAAVTGPLAARPEQHGVPVAPPGAAPAPLPLEKFAELPFFESPQLSPDGSKIAVRLAVQGQQRFAIIPLGERSKIVQIGLRDYDLNGWRWVNNDWLVATVGATRKVEGDSWYLRRTLAISADGRTINALGKDLAGQNADDILWVANDGSPHIRLALQTSIYSNELGFWPEVRDYDVTTGKSRTVQAPVEHVFDWYADPAGTVRYGTSYDDTTRAYRLLYRSNAGVSFRTISKARGKHADLADIPAVFLPQADRAVVYDDDDGFSALYAYDLATFKTGDKLFAAPGYDIDSIVTGDGGSRLVGARYTDTRPRTHWFDPALADIQAKIDASVGGRTAQIVSWSRDFTVLIVLVGGADQPGTYYIFRPAEGVMHLLAHASDAFGGRGQAPVTTIRYRARDGLEIAAVLTVPKGASAKHLPLILMPHGGPFARDDEEWDWWAQFLASRGYAVLQPNYRGSSGYGNEFAARGKGQWGLAMQDDLDDAVKWAAATGLADAARVCIVGGSYGGYAALRAAERNDGIYRCAVSFAGVSDMSAMLRYDGSFLNGGRSTDWLHEQAPDLRAVSPLAGAARFQMPLLMIHGAADNVVPVAQSRSMAARLKAAGKPVRYVEQPLGDHHLSRQADREQFLRELDAFLQANNPAVPAGNPAPQANKPA